MERKSRPFFEFQIVAGELKGRTIKVPQLAATRPPLTRLRRAIFDFLVPFLHGATYLDLFTGTGSYLFEAISRGATRAVGVELNRQLVDSINHQAAGFGLSERLVCRCDDVFAAIKDLSDRSEKFDIIMIAPPQYEGLIDRTLESLRDHCLTTEDSLILCQHDSSETAGINFQGFSLQQQRRYGNTTFSILGGL